MNLQAKNQIFIYRCATSWRAEVSYESVLEWWVRTALQLFQIINIDQSSQLYQVEQYQSILEL